MQWDYGTFIVKQLDYLPSFSTSDIAPRWLSARKKLELVVWLLGPRRGPSHKMQPFSSPKGGSWSQAFHAWTVQTGDKASIFVSTVFWGEVFGKNRVLYFGVTYKDVDRFQKGSVHEL